MDYNSTSSSTNNRLNANMNRNTNNSNEFDLIENERAANKKPEKLFSPRLNQRMMPQNMSNQQQQQPSGMQAATINGASSVSTPTTQSSGNQAYQTASNNISRPQQPVNGMEFDDTGSIHSCVSKLSSSSVQSEVQRVDKGANRLKSTMVMNGEGIPEDQTGLDLDLSQAIESLEMQIAEPQAQQQQPSVQQTEAPVATKEPEPAEAKPKKKKGKLTLSFSDRMQPRQTLIQHSFKSLNLDMPKRKLDSAFSLNR